MSETFQPGDMVELNSGGPKMRVRGPGIDNEDFIECVFFDGSRVLAGEIPPQCLIKVQAEP